MPMQGVLGTTDVRRNPSRLVRRIIDKEATDRGGVSTRSGASTRGSSLSANRQTVRPSRPQRYFAPEPTTSEENSSNNRGRVGAASAAGGMSSDRSTPSSMSSPAEPTAPLRIGGPSARGQSVPARRSATRPDPGDRTESAISIWSRP
eukprot:GHVU01032145.1.p2 GENE.GHVU01032145.1~~GHVU01032145.1.p2  ORF type:complete len:148 (+),score=1.89 GHVU01032145.1:173-616(+)